MGLNIFYAVTEPIALYGCEVLGPLVKQDGIKWDKHQIETLHAEFCKCILRAQRQIPNNAGRAESGRCPIINKIQKRELTFYNHLKESDSNPLHNKALTHRELSPLKPAGPGTLSSTQQPRQQAKPN